MNSENHDDFKQSKRPKKRRSLSFYITSVVLILLILPNAYMGYRLVYDGYWLCRDGVWISDNPDQIYEDALMKIQYGRFSGLEKDLSTAIEKFPNYIEFRRLRGFVYMGTGKLKEAYDDFIIRYNEQPNIFTLRDLTHCLFAMKKYSEVIERCSFALDRNSPFAIEIYDVRAAAYILSDKYAEAIKDYDEILTKLEDQHLDSNREEFKVAVHRSREQLINLQKSRANVR